MRRFFFLILTCSVFSFFSGNNFYGETWSLQESGVTSHLLTVCFINDQCGYAAGDSGTIIKTTNGGQRWYRLPSPTIHAISSIVFINPDTGWIAGNQGIIYKTTNGGLNWQQQNSNTTLDISDMYFLNEHFGWAVTLTANPVYLRTTDGGSTWITSWQIGFPINGIFFLDSLNGFSCGGRFDWLGFVNQSKDGGINWTAVYPIVQETMFDVAFINPQFGITIGGDHDYFGSLAYQTFDGGKTWNLQNVSDTIPSPLIGLTFIDSTNAWACGYGKIFKVNPLLQQWTLLSEPLTKWTWYAVSFANKNLGWFVGAYGKILRYDNTPVSVQESSELLKKFILYPNYPNPFNPSTIIRCCIKESAFTEIIIYNILGQPVKKLFSGKLHAGEHTWQWNGDNDHGYALASGVYFYQFKIHHRLVATRKMILIR